MKKFWGLFVIITGLWISAGSVRADGALEIINLINNRRESAGIGQLRIDSRLSRAASQKLADMQKYKYWSHSNPKTKKSWLKFVVANGYKGKVGENLSRGYTKAEKIVSAWEGSATHRANLFRSSFGSVGIAQGFVEYSTGREWVVVAIFGE